MKIKEKEEKKNSENLTHHPLITVIMPVRNEEKYIERSLQRIYEQDYPRDKIEIIVVDGMSDDKTRDIIQETDSKFPNTSLTLLDNPGRIVPTALNIGINQSRGDIIIRVDGHCEIPKDYFKTCIKYLKEPEVYNVGGMQFPVGEDYISKAIAIATSSPLFIGNSYFRYSQKKRFVDTVFLGAFPGEVFHTVGMFDEELVRHQDYEYNIRLQKHGGKILYLPSIKVKYYPRNDLVSFIKQYFQYGFWKFRVMQKTQRAFKIRHFAPTIFSIYILLGGVLGIINEQIRFIYYLGLILYVLAALTSSIYVSIKEKKFSFLPILPILFASIHLSWGLGFWWGAIYWNIKRLL